MRGYRRLRRLWSGWLLAFVLAAILVPRAMAARDAASAGVSDEILRATLPNGLRVVIVPDRLAPVVTTELSYLAGSNDAPDGFPGTAHALEHMMFRGSQGLDKDQLSELGALLGGDYNAETSETVTKYTYTGAAADLGLILRSEALRMRGLLINQADWEQERGAIEQEVSADLSDPFYNYYSRLQAILFADSPYAHDALGTRESFDRTDAGLLRDFYQRWYAPNNAVLVIAGDVQPEAALAEVRALFGNIPARKLSGHAAGMPQMVQPQTLTLPTNFPVGLVTLAYRMPGLKSADFAAADILGDVLNSKRGSLYALVPAGRALMAQFSFRPMADAGFGVVIAAFPEGGDPVPLLADIQNVVADLVRNGAPEHLVAAAKRQELAQLEFRNDSISGLATSWSRALTMEDAESPEDIARAYAAVTVSDVNRVARQVLDPDHAVTAFLTPRRAGDPAIGAGFGAPESFNRPPDHPVALPDWAASALAGQTLPDAAEPPESSVLPNGLRLIVQPEHVSQTVSVYGRVRQVTETQEPPGKEGISTLLDRLYEYGTEKRDRLGLREAADELAAREGAGGFFHLQVLAARFEDGMRLLAEHELHPALPAAAFDVVRGQVANSLAGLLNTPDYRFHRAVRQAIMPANDPVLRQATPETVMGLRLDDVRAYHATAYRPDLTTILIMGDVTPDEARRVVAEAFGAWQSTGPTPAIDLPPIGPNHASTARVTDPSSVQASVIMAETVTLPITHPDRYPLMLGNTILGDGFSSRLYRDLRVRTGYVYSVDSNLVWSRTRGQYRISFGADADKVELARQLVLRNISDMIATPVGEAELARAKAQVLRQLQMERASVNAIASSYLYLDGLGLPLDAQQIAARRYLEITAADIQRAFAAWLRPDDLATVIKGPASAE